MLTSIETKKDQQEEEQLIKPPTSHPPHQTPFFSLLLLLQPLKWFQTLSTTLHPTLVVGIILVYGLSHGFGGSYFRVASDYYFKDVQRVPPSSSQLFVGFFYLPWLIRPLWGLLTDVFPVAGFRRRPYLVAGGLAGAASAAAVAGVSGLPVAAAVVCMAGVSAGMAVANVTIDACVAKSSIEAKEVAADLQSLCWVCSSVGSLVGFLCSGFFVHALGAQGALGLLVIPPASVLILGFLIYELRITSSAQVSSNKVIERVGGAMKNMQITIRIPQVWKPTLYMFLSMALSFSTHEGHFYWYTDAKDGPGFSKEFVGMIYAVGSVGSIMGVLIYHNLLKDIPFRKLLFFAQLLYAISGMLDLMFILRWNLALGIPDSFFIIMEESVLHAISRFRWMPMVVLCTRLCPLGIEGTFFALLMSIDSLGSFSSKMVGGMVLHLLHISRTDFSNLWLAVLIRNCLRFGTLALIFLVPDATQYDVLVPSDHLGDHSLDNNISEEDLVLQLVPLNEKIEI